MKKKTIFYYQFKPINGWLFLNIIFAAFLIHCSFRFPVLLLWWQMQVLIGTCLFSWGLWIYKYLLKHPIAIIDDESITIDHCQPLYWKDIENAEEKMVRCGLRKLRVIILNPKDGLDYAYNFLQRHNGEFTAFSLPLYDVISVENAKKMKSLIAKKVKLVKLKSS